LQLDPPPDAPLWVVSVPNVLLHLREAAELCALGIHPTAPGGVRLVNGEALVWQRGERALRREDGRLPVRAWLDTDAYAISYAAAPRLLKMSAQCLARAR
jgi:hypothetical protein